MLYAACGADYAARWPDFDAPNFSDCAAFLAASLITIELRGRALDDVLVSWGMARLEIVSDSETAGQILPGIPQ